MPKDAGDIMECPTKNWWTSSGRYVVLGVITFLVLLLFFYVYKMLRSFSRQLHNLTDIISDQQERLNLHSKLIFNTEQNVVPSPAQEIPKLCLKDVHLAQSGDKIEQFFHLSNSTIDEPIVDKEDDVADNHVFEEKKDDDKEIDIEKEIADEIKELQESVKSDTTNE